MIGILSLIIWAALLLYAIPRKILSIKEKREQQSFEKNLIQKHSVDEALIYCWHCEWCGNNNPNSSHVCNVCGRGTKNNNGR